MIDCNKKCVLRFKTVIKSLFKLLDSVLVIPTLPEKPSFKKYPYYTLTVFYGKIIL